MDATVKVCLEPMPPGYAEPEPWKLVRLVDVVNGPGWQDNGVGRYTYAIARDGAILRLEHAGGACGGQGTWCVVELAPGGAFRRRLYHDKDGWEVQE